MVLTIATLADPFLIIYAQVELNVPTTYIGTYLIVITLARFLSGPLFAFIERRGGPRSVMQTTALFQMLAPLIALVLPYIADSELYQDRFDDNRPIFYAFAAVYFAIGISLAGQARGNFGYLMTNAPVAFRPAFARMGNALLAVAALAPLIGAELIERYSYDTLFSSAAIVGLVAVLLSGLLAGAPLRPRAMRPNPAPITSRGLRQLR
jgi:MFS family permease